jgi:hypothetical protein
MRLRSTRMRDRGSPSSLEEHATLALQAEPRGCFPYISLGIRDMVYWRWTDAPRIVPPRRAGQENACVRLICVFLSSYVGEHERAIALAEDILRASPDNAAFFILLGFSQAYAGDYEPDDSFYTLMFLKMNVARDPVLERPEFADVRSRIHGH